MSPSFTVSPTFFNQEATVPSVIVSLKRGIVTISTPAGTAAPVAAGAGAAAGVATSALAGAGAPPPIRAEMSSPSLPMIANRVSTFALSPSCKPMYNRVPE